MQPIKDYGRALFNQLVGVIGDITKMFKKITAILFLSLLAGIVTPVLSDDSGWEYQVVILKGITAGGRIEKQSSGIYIDTKRTETLNALADDGWEVVSVVGAPGSDHAVYLRRHRSK
jgi:hypothetical protein